MRSALATHFFFYISFVAGEEDGATDPTCQWVELSRFDENTLRSEKDYVSPGHCHRLATTSEGRHRSRLYSCFKTGGKMFVKEYASEDCTGQMILDHRITQQHFEPMLLEDGWSVSAYNCKLPLCYIAETTTGPSGATHYRPADREHCTKDEATGFYSWGKCTSNYHNLEVHYDSECHGETASHQKTLLTYDNAATTTVGGVVRDWDCEFHDWHQKKQGLMEEREAELKKQKKLHDIARERAKAEEAAKKLHESEASAPMMTTSQLGLLVLVLLVAGFLVSKLMENKGRPGSERRTSLPTYLRTKKDYQRVPGNEEGRF